MKSSIIVYSWDTGFHKTPVGIPGIFLDYKFRLLRLNQGAPILGNSWDSGFHKVPIGIFS